MTAVVEGMHIFRTNRETGYKAITESTRQKDPVLLERTYDSYLETIRCHRRFARFRGKRGSKA